MNTRKSVTFPIAIFGYLILTLGIFGTGDYYVTKYLFSYGQNMGIVIGNTAMTLLGLSTIVLAKAIKKLEDRLKQVERANGSIPGD